VNKIVPTHSHLQAIIKRKTMIKITKMWDTRCRTASQKPDPPLNISGINRLRNKAQRILRTLGLQ
jgi:hypothetical protein